MKTTLFPSSQKVTEITPIHPADIPEFYETETGAAEEREEGFASLTFAEKRFHIMFYALAGITGLVLVQLIWQIAVLTSR